MESENKAAKANVESSRFTRSKVSPEWSVEETLILVSEIGVVNKDCLKALSSYQKWKMISDNCAALGLVRSSMQCRRKWELMLPQYRNIKEWELESFHSYWCLETQTKLSFRLPLSFDKLIFQSIDDLHESLGGRLDSDLDSDPEALVVTTVDDEPAIFDSGPKKQRRALGHKKQRRRKSRNSSSLDKKHEILSDKLREDAELIHTILSVRGDVTDNTSTIPHLADLNKSGECDTDSVRRRQGDEVIKVLGSLAGTLEQFAVLVKESA